MNPDAHSILDGLPGGAMIEQGLIDHDLGRRTIASCLVRIASPRLARAGLLDRLNESPRDAELQLYQLLAPEGSRAYSRYNAIMRELVSFEHALDQRLKPSFPSSASSV